MKKKLFAKTGDAMLKFSVSDDWVEVENVLKYSAVFSNPSIIKVEDPSKQLPNLMHCLKGRSCLTFKINNYDEETKQETEELACGIILIQGASNKVIFLGETSNGYDVADMYKHLNAVLAKV